MAVGDMLQAVNHTFSYRGGRLPDPEPGGSVGGLVAVGGGPGALLSECPVYRFDGDFWHLFWHLVREERTRDDP